ncbi:MAG: transcription elongation factor GreA [Gammaproteobacteria bacterium RIFCSPLOWO2_02_FULL_56_15]|nr:MAG: transcription elongation factor GreA [Gammaproteobacteria bacterium RIFCSPLOWO2_02_FULL_56_15]
MNSTPITTRGVEKLRAQLRQLKTVDRPRITHAIAEARAHGDLSENAEYHAAREQQSFTEGRIAAIESVLSEARVIDVSTIDAGGRVVFGATVDLLNLGNHEAVTYQIVGEEEADMEQRQVSISSPIARALIGKESGDIAEVKAPGGIIEYEVVDVRYV